MRPSFFPFSSHVQIFLMLAFISVSAKVSDADVKHTSMTERENLGECIYFALVVSQQALETLL